MLGAKKRNLKLKLFAADRTFKASTEQIGHLVWKWIIRDMVALNSQDASSKTQKRLVNYLQLISNLPQKQLFLKIVPVSLRCAIKKKEEFEVETVRS